MTGTAKKGLNPFGIVALGLVGFCFVLMIVGMFLPSTAPDITGRWEGVGPLGNISAEFRKDERGYFDEPTGHYPFRYKTGNQNIWIMRHHTDLNGNDVEDPGVTQMGLELSDDGERMRITGDFGSYDYRRVR